MKQPFTMAFRLALVNLPSSSPAEKFHLNLVGFNKRLRRTTKENPQRFSHALH